MNAPAPRPQPSIQPDRRPTAELAGALGVSGSTPADLREVANQWEDVARYATARGFNELAARDLRFAQAMRAAADILEAKDDF